MRPHIAWVLVADGQRARILERPAPGDAWVELSAETRVEPDPPSRDLGSDRPGRVRESVGGARHAIEPRQDPHDARKLAFARSLAARLEAAATAHRYARLILVAPPHCLGERRAALGDATRALLRGSLDLDLTHAPLAEIVARLPDHRPV